jgi:hypothetical protein
MWWCVIHSHSVSRIVWHTGKFVISVDDMMPQVRRDCFVSHNRTSRAGLTLFCAPRELPQGVIETMDAALVGRLSKLKTVS